MQKYIPNSSPAAFIAENSAKKVRIGVALDVPGLLAKTAGLDA
jgi:hypothetical protein